MTGDNIQCQVVPGPDAGDKIFRPGYPLGQRTGSSGIQHSAMASADKNSSWKFGITTFFLFIVCFCIIDMKF